MAKLLTVMAGALLFIWPALLNGYPIAFSDTGGFLEQALMPDIGWDKPWIYGPFLTPFHLRLTLWPTVFAQALLLSAMLWLAQAALGQHRKTYHLLLCALLAAGSAAPWFASLLMPDIFAPITVLGLFVLAYGQAPGRACWTAAWVTVVTTLAIAAHLAHLVLAAAGIAALALTGWRTLARTAPPLLAALALLLASNVVGNGLFAISPYGADFALARLVADGPARDTIEQACPAAAWRLCAWKGRLPTNADDFLWDPNGPVWAQGYGPILLAPEAAAIVRATLLAQPLQVLAAAARNTARQIVRTDIGDALIPDYLDLTVLPRLLAYFPPAEAARFTASLQARGGLPLAAIPLHPLHAALLLIGTVGTMVVAAGQWRTNRAVAVFAGLIIIALIANAAATGALSGPHDRYQSRIAWLVLLPPLAALRRRTTSRTPALPTT